MLANLMFPHITKSKNLVNGQKGTPVLQKIIAMDREQTGTCHFTMASESFWPGHLYYFFQKKSFFKVTTNRGY